MKYTIVYSAFLFFFTALTSCNTRSNEKAETGDKVETNSDSEVIKVLQFNIWGEGVSVTGGFDAMIDEIINTQADLIALSEVRNYDDQSLAKRMVNALAEKGHTYYSERSEGSGIVSKFPILSQEAIYPLKNDQGSVTKAMIDAPSGPIAFYSAHLDYTHYACYLPRGYDGITWKKLDAPVLDIKSILEQNGKSMRDEAMSVFIQDALEEQNKGSIILFGGDFNEPSHVDWGEASKDLFDHNGAVVPWQNSIALEENGFLDAYRVKYPDPVTHPGLTWAANNTDAALDKLIWTPEADDRERIDFIYYYPNKRLTLKEVVIVGPVGSIAKGKRIDTNPGQDKFLAPKGIWPSDHKAVLATFELDRIK